MGIYVNFMLKNVKNRVILNIIFFIFIEKLSKNCIKSRILGKNNRNICIKFKKSTWYKITQMNKKTLINMNCQLKI